MKNKIKVSVSRLLFAMSIFVFSLLLSKTGFAQASYEVMCRNKAKEVAADSYKGCMTEQRQAQIEQIRRDYKDKLSKLKNHYDKELKKLSSGQAPAATTASQSATITTSSSSDNGPEIVLKKVSSKTKTRVSGGKLPEKKSAVSAASSTQVIDLSAPIESQINTPDEPVQSQSRVKSSDDNEAEVVDLPTQE